MFEFNCLYTARSDIIFQGKNERYIVDYKTALNPYLIDF